MQTHLYKKVDDNEKKLKKLYHKFWSYIFFYDFCKTMKAYEASTVWVPGRLTTGRRLSYPIEKRHVDTFHGPIWTRGVLLWISKDTRNSF